MSSRAYTWQGSHAATGRSRSAGLSTTPVTAGTGAAGMATLAAGIGAAPSPPLAALLSLASVHQRRGEGAAQAPAMRPVRTKQSNTFFQASNLRCLCTSHGVPA